MPAWAGAEMGSSTVCARIGALLPVILAALVAAASAGAWDEIAAGRAAIDRSDPDAAIAAFHRAIDIDPSIRDTIAVALASQLTWVGRYDEAIAEFRSYLDRHPGATGAMKTLALAQSWSGRNAEALATYRAILARAPEDRDAAFGEARILSWTGRLDDSLDRYEAILRRDPMFVDAALGRAQVVNWRGDHRRAAGHYGAILEADRANLAALEGRAAAWNWAGLQNRAIHDLEASRAAGGPTKDALDLERTIRAAWAPAGRATVDLSRDSDSFRLLSYRLDGDLGFQYRARIRPALVRNEYRKPRRPDAEDLWLGAGGDWRFSEDGLLYGSILGLVHPPDGIASRATGDLHAAWLRDDRVRVDLGYARASYFTYERTRDLSPRFVDADIYDFGVRIRPEWRTTVDLAVDRGFYSDDNRRLNLRARVRRAILSRPRLSLELGGQWLDYDEDLAGGLWTPQEFRGAHLAPECEWSPIDRLTLFARVDAGAAKDKTSDLSSFLTYAGGARYEAGGLLVELRGGHADSNLEIGRGYRRDFGTLTLRLAP